MPPIRVPSPGPQHVMAPVGLTGVGAETLCGAGNEPVSSAAASDITSRSADPSTSALLKSRSRTTPPVLVMDVYRVSIQDGICAV